MKVWDFACQGFGNTTVRSFNNAIYLGSCSYVYIYIYILFFYRSIYRSFYLSVSIYMNLYVYSTVQYSEVLEQSIVYLAWYPPRPKSHCLGPYTSYCPLMPLLELGHLK